MSSATSLVRAVLRSAAARGVEPATLLARGGLEAHTVEDRDARVPTEAYLRVFAAAVELTGDPTLAADAARALDAAAFGLLGFVVASSPTVREALLRFSRYSRLLCDELQVQLVEGPGEVAIVYTLDVAPRVPALFEMALTHLVSTSRRGTRGAFSPREVTFRHRTRPHELPALLGPRVSFGAERDAVVCAPDMLALPLRGANPALLGVLESHVALVLGALPADDDLLDHTRRAIRALLPRGEPTLEATARRLGLGARTLQRRLQSHQLTFRDVLDDVRKQCALEQLAQPDVSVAEVAFSLGFSGPSSFHHAFRRWTGRSPRHPG